MSNVKNSDFFTLNVIDAVKAFHNNDLTACELATSCIKRYKLIEPRVHAWAYFSEDIILEQAENIEETVSLV